MSQRLGDLLVKEKIITPEQLEQANKVQKEQSCRLGSALVKLGFLTDEDVTNFLSRQYGVPAINLSYFEIDPAVVKLIPFETAKRYQILPLSRVGASLTIAMVDPTNVFAMDDIKFMTGFNIEPVVASESSILEGIDKAYGATKEEDLEQVMLSMSEMDESDVELQADQAELGLADLEKAADEAPIVKLVNLVLTDAVKRGKQAVKNQVDSVSAAVDAGQQLPVRALPMQTPKWTSRPSMMPPRRPVSGAATTATAAV